MPSKHFGGKLSQHWRETYEASPNWKDGSFQNTEVTQSAINWRQLPGMLYKQLKGHKEGYPRAPLPLLPLDATHLLAPSDRAKFVWQGHSAVLMRINNRTLWIDPMLGPDAAPIAPTTVKRFSGNALGHAEALPEVDLVLISHDHYDHLDYESIAALKAKTRHYFVALGVKRHLVSWGIEAHRIEEFDWWQTRPFHGIHITFTPTRHFSGRGLTSMAKCLWGGWALKTDSQNIWFSGDSGYSGQFREIGERLGPFDFGLMECGQYCVDWPQIHLFPHESVQAALDARVQVAMPVHWGGFNLSYQHAWYEPVEQFVEHAGNSGLAYLTPALGRVFEARTDTGPWWKAHR